MSQNKQFLEDNFSYLQIEFSQGKKYQTRFLSISVLRYCQWIPYPLPLLFSYTVFPKKDSSSAYFFLKTNQDPTIAQKISWKKKRFWISFHKWFLFHEMFRGSKEMYWNWYILMINLTFDGCFLPLYLIGGGGWFYPPSFYLCFS